MTATAAPTVKDQELITLGLVDSKDVNSISDLNTSQLNESYSSEEKQKDDFINIFICHLIFYAIFCVSLVLHILIDLGLGYFIKNIFNQVVRLKKETVFEKSPAFA